MNKLQVPGQPGRISLTIAGRALHGVTLFWFIVFFLGQLIFAGYIIMLYWKSALMGTFDKWNEATPNLYIRGQWARNALFGVHAVIAGWVSIAGPLQLVPWLRRVAPRCHRISGRVYVVAGFLIALDGIYLAWRGGAVGSFQDHVIISLNAVIIMITAWFTIRHARARNLRAHQQWAVHLVLAMSGVWMFRVFLMFWLVVNQGPVGFDPGTFSGPFLDVLAVTVYVFPQVVVAWYFRVRRADGPMSKWVFTVALTVITLAMLAGVVAATMGMWWPRLI